MFAENDDWSNADHQGISTSLAQVEPQLGSRGVVPEGAGSAMAPPDFGRPQTKPTVNWVLGAGQLKEDQTTQQPQQIPIHQRNKQPIYQQNTQQWYGTSAVSSLQSSDADSGWAGRALAHPEFGSSVDPIPTRGADYALQTTACPPEIENLATPKQSNKFIGNGKNHQIRSNLLSIPLAKSLALNKKRSGRSKNETKIPRTNPSNIPPMVSNYPEYWPDQIGKDGHPCCYYCGIQSHVRSECYTLRKDILKNGSDYRAFHPLRGHDFKKAKKKSWISLQSMRSIEPAPSNTHQIESNLSPLDTIKSKEVGKNENLEEKIEKKKFQLRKKNSLFL